MKSCIRRLTAFLIVVAILFLSCGVSGFAAVTVDHICQKENSMLSGFIENFGKKNYATTVAEYPESVHSSEVSSSNERILNIWETSSSESPLENISFAIYRVCSLDEYLGGTINLNTIPSEDEIEKYAIDNNCVSVITTNDDGYATHSFGYGENDGVYMVAELENSAVPDTAKPFYVSLPMSNADNTELLYTVNVYPKNDVEYSIPLLNKDIMRIDNKFSSFDINEEHTWIIRGSVPSDIKDALSYKVFDRLEKGLTYIADSVSVAVAEKTEIENNNDLKEFTDYITDVYEEDGCTNIEISLTEIGMKNIAGIAGNDYDKYEIRIYISTMINTDAGVGVDIINSASLGYENAVGHEFFIEVECAPKISTGGLNILKVDSLSEKNLSGAEFKLARDASPDDVKSGKYESIRVSDSKNNIVTKNVVYVDFYSSRDMSGKIASSVVTNANGEAHMYGLAYGTYYLVEIKAPDGYEMLNEAVEVVINDLTHIEGNRVKVVNSHKSVFPLPFPPTDDLGATAVKAAVVILFAATVIVIWSGRKKKNEK